YDAIGRLTGAFCGGPVDPTLVSLVQDQTRGNPFFVHEMLRGLKDSGKLAFDGTEWRTAAADADLTPGSSTLQGLIASRIDGLPADARRALCVASVIGQQVDMSVLTDVLTPEAPGPVEPLVALLSRHHLVTADQAFPGSGVRFAHALIQT